MIGRNAVKPNRPRLRKTMAAAPNGTSRFRLARYQPFQTLERCLQHLAQVFGVSPHGLFLFGIGGLLTRLQNHLRGIGSVGLELDPNDGFRGEPRGRPPAKTLRLVPSFQ